MRRLPQREAWAAGQGIETDLAPTNFRLVSWSKAQAGKATEAQIDLRYRIGRVMTSRLTS